MNDLHGDDSGSRQMAHRLKPSDLAGVVAEVVGSGALCESDDVVVLYDLDRMESVLDDLAAAFPKSCIHTIAVKANPLVEILVRIRERGFGVEVASIGEVQLAIQAGFAPEKIVFDSPAKTRFELVAALDAGLTINANCIAEVDRIAELWPGRASQPSQIGVRVNPGVGAGEIDSTSTAKRASKFGVPLDHCPELLKDRLHEHAWITGLHVHIGSQGMAVEQLVEGVGRIADLYEDVRGSANLSRFNLGGGLPVAYRSDDLPATFAEYSAALRLRAPGIFDSDTSLGTEFGRAVHANSGWVASRIEYVLDHGDNIPTLVVHVGADMFVRKAYRPTDWHHDMSVTTRDGALRNGDTRLFRVAGPLCFAGDYLSDGIQLPADTVEGDFLLIRDAGAYTFSMWSVYNSRRFPAVLGYADHGKAIHQLREAQTVGDLVAFWSVSTR